MIDLQCLHENETKVFLMILKRMHNLLSWILYLIIFEY